MTQQKDPSISARDNANELLIKSSLGATLRETAIRLFIEDYPEIVFDRQDYTGQEWADLELKLTQRFNKNKEVEK